MTGVPPLDWDEVERLFTTALALPDAEARAWLAEACAGRPPLLAEVEALLAAHARPGLQLEHAGTTAARPPVPGSVLGNYRLGDLIGAGGMASVYRGERIDGAFAQPVAVKVIGRPMTDAVAARRVRAEREILAALRHPHIVSLLDAGVTGSGHAYLVMELVDGTPITTYCRDRRLPLAARLDLFRSICSAVHYAHRHGVVHRDLKPENILVTVDGTVKVLDFGIAKLVEARQVHGADLGVTAEGTGPFTPTYASPEQVRGIALTTSSDIYALGVLLYELVVGARPYETQGKPYDEVIRLVTQVDPPRPSTRTAGPGVPYALHRALAGDLDAIVLRAMAKEPERRYPSADDFGADVRRHLSGAPVVAREPSVGYLARRLLARHKLAALSLAFGLVALVVGLVAATWQARVARQERDRAQAVSSFLGNVFRSANPTATTGPVTVRDLLDQGAAALEKELAGDPAAQAALMFVIAESYDRLAVEDRAAALLDRAVTSWEAAGDTQHRDMYRALRLRGRLHRRGSEFAAAIATLGRALSLAEAIEGPDSHDVVLILRELALAHKDGGDRGQTRPMLERAIRIEERLAPASATNALLHNNLANVLVDLGDFRAARPLFERSIAIYDGLSGAERWGLVLPTLSLGDMLRLDDDSAAAETVFARALAIDDDVFGRESPSSAYTLSRLGDAKVARGDLAGGRRAIDEAFAIYGRTRSRDHGDLAAPTLHRARLHAAEGRIGPAADDFADAVRRFERLHSPSHPNVAAVLTEQATFLLATTGPEAAEPLLRRALDIQRTALAPGHRALVPTLTALARVLRATGRDAEAAPLVDEAVGVARASLPEQHSRRVAAESLQAPTP